MSLTPPLSLSCPYNCSPSLSAAPYVPSTEDVSRKRPHQETVDCWAEYRNLFQLIKAISPSDPEIYANPEQLLHLPFPFIGLPPSSRFEISEGRFPYMGREKFRELWESVEKISPNRWGEIFLYGTSGYGKSHLLAALACFLIQQGKEVVYLPDCRTMLLGFVNYIKSALLLAFSGSEERQEQVWGLKNAEDIQNFLEQPAHWGLYIIIDQVNALETSKASQDESSNSVKEKVRTFLNTLSFHHHVIRSASPNFVTFQHMQRKQTHDIKITAQNGLSKVSNRCQKISFCGVADDGPAGDGGVVEEAWRPRFVRIYQVGDRGLDGMCATASDRYLKKWEQH